MRLYADCTSVDINEWNSLMKGTRPCSGKLLRKKVKEYLPELYEALCLDYYNPYKCQCKKKKAYMCMYIRILNIL